MAIKYSGRVIDSIFEVANAASWITLIGISLTKEGMVTCASVYLSFSNRNNDKIASPSLSLKVS